MRLLIFILALTSAFFVSANPPEGFPDDLIWPGVPPEAKTVHVLECYTNKLPEVQTFKSHDVSANIESCKELAVPNVPNDGCTYWARSSFAGPYSSGNISYGSTKNHPEAKCGGHSVLYYSWQRDEVDLPYCPTEQHPEHTEPYSPNGVVVSCHLLKPLDPDPDLDPDCPAPTDNDPYVFGTGIQQTLCFDNPDGTQCSITTEENGNFYMPISYGSQEPVQCRPDPEPDPDTDPEPEPTPDPEQPDDTPDPEKTPEPDPSPEPEPTDDSDVADLLPALNQVNNNLHAINNNMNNGFDGNHQRLDRLALETQNSNELLSSIKQNTAATAKNTGNTLNEIGKSNDLLYAIKEAQDKTNENLEQPYDSECIGELCDLDIDSELDSLDLELKEFIEAPVQKPTEITGFTSGFTSFVTQNFAGFKGQCQPFTLDVSIASEAKSIVVSQHCEPYETYFKPLVEWLLWTFTAIALLNISSQSFRAFSTI